MGRRDGKDQASVSLTGHRRLKRPAAWLCGLLFALCLAAWAAPRLAPPAMADGGGPALSHRDGDPVQLSRSGETMVARSRAAAASIQTRSSPVPPLLAEPPIVSPQVSTSGLRAAETPAFSSRSTAWTWARAPPPSA